MFQARKLIKAEYLVLFASLGMLAWARYGAHLWGSRRLGVFLLGSLVFYLLGRSDRLRSSLGKLSRIVSPAAAVFTVTLSAMLFYFLLRFPLKDWTSYILALDYPVVLNTSREGWEILKQGAYFGWNPSAVGGYFTVADLSLNLVHLFFPFLFLGWEAAFHLLLLLFFLAFPVLCFYYALTVLKVDLRSALLTVPVAAIFGLTYFDNLLLTGMVGAFAGVNLLIMALIFFQRLKEGLPRAFFLTLAVLSFLLYTHLGMLSFCIALIVFELILRPNPRDLRRFLLLFVFLAGVAAPIWVFKIKYSAYFNLSPIDYLPVEGLSLNSCLDGIKNNCHFLFDASYFGEKLTRGGGIIHMLAFFLPVSIYMFFHPAWKKPVVLILLIFIAFVLITRVCWHWLSRSIFLLPFGLTLVLAGFLAVNYKRRNLFFLSASLLLGLALFLPFSFSPIAHGRPGDFYNPDLVSKIRTLGGYYILVEHGTDYAPRQQVPTRFFYLPLFRLETGKKFFSNLRGGYHFTVYRKNSLQDDGFFGGRPINEWRIGDMNSVFSQWGIRYLAVRSRQNREYFTAHPDFYKRIWHNGGWEIFKYLQADTRYVAVEGEGEGVCVGQDYFSQTIELKNVEESSPVTVRCNYFPAWKAYYNGREIQVFDANGQLGFLAPGSGSYRVSLKYPRYAFLNLLAISFFVAAFFF